jgi:transcriptional regulator GlxA family with amidase domain
LLNPDDHCHPRCIESVGEAIITRAMMHDQADRRYSALPKWQLLGLERFLAANVEKQISLQDVAAAAALLERISLRGCGPATGFRPHEYLLFKRVEQATITMSET